MRPIFRSDSSKVGVQSLLCIAHMAVGEVDEGVAVATEALERSPEHFHGWEAVAGVLATFPAATALPILVDLALRDPSGRFLDPVVSRISAAWIGRFALGYVDRGGRLPAVLSTGLLASLVANESDLFEQLAHHAELLDADTAERIAERASVRGRGDLADVLRRHMPLAGVVG
jgi:hypothetical protein